MSNTLFRLIICIFSLFSACKKKDNPPFDPVEKSDQKEISHLIVRAGTTDFTPVLQSDGKTWICLVRDDFNMELLKTARITFRLSEGATASPVSGATFDLSSSKDIVVTAEDESIFTYTVGIEVEETEEKRDYTFEGGIVSREVLNNYLSRAITQCEFLTSGAFYIDGAYAYNGDDTRMLKNIGAKFIGRSIYRWGSFDAFNNPAFLKNAKTKIEGMHAFDPEIIFQAAIFEIVNTPVNNVPVPAWVFEAFGKPVESRNFRYNDMLNSRGALVNFWATGASVPDISQLETRMFFYYMARQYMEIGIEAIHFGQAELMGMSSDYAASWSDLLGKVRNAASTVARRGTVICDAHLPSGGMVVKGQLLFDFVSFPLRLKEVVGEPQKAVFQKYHLDALYGRTKSGVTPSGWICVRCPLLVEFDNFGISDQPGVANIGWTWGYDEISWFSNQPEIYRNEFLEYAHDWIQKNDPYCFLQMPGSRVTSGANANRYRANTESRTCPYPHGKSQEETIKKIWNENK